MTHIKDMARAALPAKLWSLLQQGRQKGKHNAYQIRADLRRYIDLRGARKALLRSDALSNDEKDVLRKVSLRLHRGDFYLPGKGRHYLSIGLTSLHCINAALDHAPNPVRTILVFPSGHGRILRFLKVRFPRATICASDIKRETVEFCRREFHVAGIVSSDDFSKVSLPGPFDLIWSGSLLTHLNESQSKELLRLYYRNLAPGGLCVFTTQGSTPAAWLRSGAETYNLTEAARRKILSEFDDRGYGYAHYEVGPGYDGSAGPSYGISLATRTRVVEMAAAAGDWTLSSFFERAWSDQQDVYAFTKGPTKASLIVEARGPVPAVSNVWRWTL
jgi:SAM-dependent methyltransferase